MHSWAYKLTPAAVPLSNKSGCLKNENQDEPLDKSKEEHDVVYTASCSITNVSVREPDSLNEHELLKVEVKVHGHKAICLIDSGSSHDFIAESFVKKHGLHTSNTADLQVTPADSSKNQVSQTTVPIKTVIRDVAEMLSFMVFPLSTCDGIIGMPWLSRSNPPVNFKPMKSPCMPNQLWHVLYKAKFRRKHLNQSKASLYLANKPASLEKREQGSTGMGQCGFKQRY